MRDATKSVLNEPPHQQLSKASTSLSETVLAEPLVDVLIPVRNGGALLGDAISSVLRQTMPKFRLVVINNNSNDDTAIVARSFADPRVQIINHDETRSLFENVNYCLTQVQAPFFCILHADDRLLPEYLEVMIPHLRDCSDAQIAACQVHNIDSQGRVISSIKYRLKNWVFLSVRRTVHAEDLSGRLLVAFNFMVAPSLLYRREVITFLGIFREDMSFLSDLEYLDRGLRRGAGYLIVPHVLFEYRLHAEQETSNLTRNLYKYSESLRYFTEHVPIKAGSNRMRGRLGRTAAEARVAVVILWDYITSRGPQSTTFRTAVIQYLLSTPILVNFRLLWRLLEAVHNWPLFTRRILCAIVIGGMLLPIVIVGLFD